MLEDMLKSTTSDDLSFSCRYHAVQEFNRGVFNYLIATDESGLEGIEKDSDDEESDTEEPACKLKHSCSLLIAPFADYVACSNFDPGSRGSGRNRRRRRRDLIIEEAKSG